MKVESPKAEEIRDTLRVISKMIKELIDLKRDLIHKLKKHERNINNSNN